MATDKKKKGRRVGKVTAYEVTLAAAGKNGHGVILKSETAMADTQFLDLDAPTDEAALAAALESAEPSTQKAHGDDTSPEGITTGGVDDIVEVADEDEAVTPAAAVSAVAAETVTPTAPTLQLVPPSPETSEITDEAIASNVLSFAVALEGASRNTSDAIAIAKAVASLEFLAQEQVITRIKSGEISLVVRKSCAAALGEAILQLQGVKGSEEVTEMAGNATQLFKSLRVEAPAKPAASPSVADRLAALRKSLGTLGHQAVIGVPTQPRPAAPAAPTRSVPAVSASRTEPQPSGSIEGGYSEDINV
jgi:hypothetical protein